MIHHIYSLSTMGELEVISAKFRSEAGYTVLDLVHGINPLQG